MKKQFYVLVLMAFPLFNGDCIGQETNKDSTNLPVDMGWPRQIELDKETVIIHQPQVDAWKDYLHLTARLAFEVITKDASPMHYFGAATITADTETDMEKRQVLIFNKKVVSIKFQGVDPSVADPLEKQMRALNANPEVMSLDRLLPMVADSAAEVKQIQGSVVPPTIFYSTSAAILVILDGEPYWSPVAENATLHYAVNTNWDLFFDKADSTYFLLNDKQWLTTKDLNNPWTATTSLPKSFKKLPKDDNWAEVQNNIPAQAAGKAPKVFVYNGPAEMILVEDAPKFDAVAGTSLLAVKNTESDLFLYTPTGMYYFLVSGRWFSAVSLEGPWTFATPDLPDDFKKIPEKSDYGHVLATVPGTQPAKEAAVQAEIPQTAQVDVKTQVPDVLYDGSPQFMQIEGTNMFYAQNTPSDVIKIDGKYYLCYQGAWFVSSNATKGWVVCTSVPAVIYTIPPAVPVYHVTYVHVYGYTNTYVTYGYTAGYTGVYVSYGVPMYGTGYYYPPYYHYGPYPVYYPYHYSYGCHAYYNPYTGYYGKSAHVYGPYGGAGCSAAYNPYTGTYARSRSVYGPYGAAGGAAAYNPRTGTHAYAQTVQTPYGGATRGAAYNPYTGAGGATKQGHNPYAQWGESVVTNKNGDWAHTAHYSDANGTARAFETSSGAKGASYQGDQGSAAVAKNSEGDLYVGKDGNVYKKENGEWQQAGGNNATTSQARSSAQQQPTTSQAKPSSQQQPTTSQAKPSSQQQPTTSQAKPSSQQQPTTTQAKPSTQQQPTTSQTRPSTQQQPSTSMTPTSSQLNQQQQNRDRGNTRTANTQSYQRTGGGGARMGGRRN